MNHENSNNEMKRTGTQCAVDHAVTRAKQLIEMRPPGDYTPLWVHEASHVGDLSVLALALLC